MKYEALLFDADNTILDFDKSEEQALQRAFGDMGWRFSQQILKVYRRNNIMQWQLFEQGKLTKEQVLIGRFVETFRELNLDASVVGTVSELYEAYLKEGFFTVPHAEETLHRLQRTHRLYVVSNGVADIQNGRMAGSGLDKYFVARFLSEEAGCPKPQKAYFDYCFRRIANFDRAKTLIIGDSLTSDIQGGINAGIATCWFNPRHTPNNSPITPTYIIDDLRDIYKIVY